MTPLRQGFSGCPDFQQTALHRRQLLRAGALGLAGLHKVRPKVQATPRRTVLPPDLYAQYAALSFWQDSTGSEASVIRIKSQ